MVSLVGGQDWGLGGPTPASAARPMRRQPHSTARHAHDESRLPSDSCRLETPSHWWRSVPAWPVSTWSFLPGRGPSGAAASAGAPPLCRKPGPGERRPCRTRSRPRPRPARRRRRGLHVRPGHTRCWSDPSWKYADGQRCPAAGGPPALPQRTRVRRWTRACAGRGLSLRRHNPTRLHNRQSPRKPDLEPPVHATWRVRSECDSPRRKAPL